MKNLLILILLSLCASCTENVRARSFGGSATMTLPAGQKLINITWKQTDMWYLTRPMREGETAETYIFQEDSSFGLVEGTVTIKETK